MPDLTAKLSVTNGQSPEQAARVVLLLREIRAEGK